MAIAFNQLWGQFIGTTTATSVSKTPGAAGNTLVIFGQNESGNGLTITFSGSASSFTKLGANADDTNADTNAQGYSLALVAGAQTASVGGASGNSMEGEALEYSGVDSVSDGAFNNRIGPGTGVGAILGSAVTVPVGSVLVAVCKDVSAIGADTIVAAGGGTLRDHNGGTNVHYAIVEWAGAGGSITPSFTDATSGGDNFIVHQMVLNPPAGGAGSLAYLYWKPTGLMFVD